MHIVLLFMIMMMIGFSEEPEFIWNWAIRNSCDIGTNQTIGGYFTEKHSFNKKAYQVHKKNIIWVESCFVHRFCKSILPSIKHPCVLVISVGDETFPSQCCRKTDFQDLIQNKKITHIFAQNCGIVHPKVTPIPIGIDFHTIAYAHPEGAWGETGSPVEQEAVLKKIIQTLEPTHLRQKKAFVDFHHNDTMHGVNQQHLQFKEDRTMIFNTLKDTGLIEYGEKMRRSDLWRTKGRYAFSISPPGNGLDTHRTWEDLSLGCIVIVKTSPLDPLYAGLPVVIVKDWSEITEENMNIWLEQYGDALTNPLYREKLTSRYWINKIHNRFLVSK